jgi:hypothetical protein
MHTANEQTETRAREIAMEEREAEIAASRAGSAPSGPRGSIIGSTVGGRRNTSFIDRTGEIEEIEEDENEEYGSEFDDSDLENSGDELEEAAEILAEDYADLMYNSERSADLINYDDYHFSVA